MVFWGNSFGFPSPGEVVRARSDIIALESHLEQALEGLRRAQRQVEMVTWHLNYTRAFIAPIRKLNFDVLSLIFEVATEIVTRDDFKVPLCIAGVSRLWREVIKRIPRVWNVLDRRRISDAGSVLYLNYSLPSLHVHETHKATFIHLAQMAHKVECLTATVIQDTKTPIVLPNLKRLVAGRGYICHADVTTINSFRFPNLRHLDLDTTFICNSPITDFPPLETLAIVLYNAVPWFDIMKACRDSLISLRPTLVTLNPLGLVDNKLHLPQLRYLEIVCDRHQPCWQIEIEAPGLMTYIECSNVGWFEGRFHEKLDSVHNLRLSYLPKLDNMEQLKILQLDIFGYRIKDFLDKAESGRLFLPNLRILEFSGRGISDQIIEETLHRIEESPWGSLPGLVEPPSFEYGRWTKMPGENVFECGYEPCRKRPRPRIEIGRDGRVEEEEEEDD